MSWQVAAVVGLVAWFACAALIGVIVGRACALNERSSKDAAGPCGAPAAGVTSNAAASGDGEESTWPGET